MAKDGPERETLVAALRPVTARQMIALGLAALIGGCSTGSVASVTSIGSVTPLPRVTALEGQSAGDQEWDVKDCQAEAGYRTNYSPTDSPLANLFQKLFFWGTAGAAVGGTIDGLPATVGSSEASTGLIVGASAGGAVGAAASVGGQGRYERAWVACMGARGYTIAPTRQAPPAEAPSR